MKKILSTFAAAVALTAMVALAGCSGSVAANPTDILETLDAPSVSVDVYPGVIRLSWDKVLGASSYDIYRNGTVIGNNITDCEYLDIAGTGNSILDGIKYTYDVVANVGKDYATTQNGTTNESARAVFIKQSSATVTAKAEVPNTEDFDKEYKDYFDKFADEDTKIKTAFVTAQGATYLKVTAPTLPEFKYEMYAYTEGTPDAYKGKETLNAFKVEKENATDFYRPLTEPGEWNIEVKVVPLSALYEAKTFAGTKATVKALKLNTVWNNSTGQNVEVGTTNISAKKTSATAVRIKWTPANYEGLAYATTDYTVYRFINGIYTKLTGTIGTLNVGDVNGNEVVDAATYYIDDAEYTDGARYHVVLSKDGLYETIRWSSTWYNNGSSTVSAGNQNVVWPAAADNAITGNVTNLSAAYIDAGKTIRILFEPRANEAPAMYTVYRKFGTSLTKLGEVKKTEIVTGTDWGTWGYSAFVPTTPNPNSEGLYELSNGNYILTSDNTVTAGKTYYKYQMTSAPTYRITKANRFYVTDAVADNTVNYEYLVYRTENGTITSVGSTTGYKYSTGNTAGAPSISTGWPQVVANDADQKLNDVWIKFTIADKTDSFALYRADITNKSTVLDSDFVAVTGYAYAATTAAGAYEYVMFDANLPAGKYRYRIVESAEGKNSAARETDVPVDALASSVSGPSVSWDSANHKIIITDSYNPKTETYANYTYAYQIITKTKNNYNNDYVYTDSGFTAVTLATTGTATATNQNVRAEIDKTITADTNGLIEYQVIVTKTDSASGVVKYAVANNGNGSSTLWATSN